MGTMQDDENTVRLVTSAVRRAVHAMSLHGVDSPEAQQCLRSVYAFTAKLPLRITHLSRFIAAELFGGDQSRRPVSWLDLCNPSGHVRERCVRALAEPAPNAFFFALFLQRLNDWVPQVRVAARERLPWIAAATPGDLMAEALWASLPSLGSLGRMGDAERAAFFAVIELPGVLDPLLRIILDAQAGPTARCLLLACRSPALDCRLEQIAREARQPAVRALAWRVLIEGSVEWVTARKWVWTDLRWCKGRYVAITDRRALTLAGVRSSQLDEASRDHSAYVRRTAAGLLIRCLNEVDREVARAIAARLSMEAWPLIAERGRYLLRQLHTD